MTVSERIDRLESKLGGIPDSRISRSYVESPPVNRTVILKIGWLLEIAVASEGDGHSTLLIDIISKV
jgi:hypothetical protein